MILAEQLATDPEFAEQCELLEQEARERQKAVGAEGGRGKKKISEVLAHDRQTSTILARNLRRRNVSPAQKDAVRKAMKASARR